MTGRLLFVYPHIQKTGGTSMREALVEIFGRDRILWYGWGADSNVAQMIRDRTPLPDCDIVGGHVPASGLLQLAGDRPAMLISLVRQPVQQIVSHYYELQKQPGTLLHFAGPLEDAVAGDTEFAKHSAGLQSRMLTGRNEGANAVKALSRMPHLVGRLDRGQDVLDRIAELAGTQKRATLANLNGRAEVQKERRAVLDKVRLLAKEDLVLWHHFKAIGGISERLPDALRRTA